MSQDAIYRDRSVTLMRWRRRAIQLLLACFVVAAIGFFIMYNGGDHLRPAVQNTVIYAVFCAVIVGLASVVCALVLPALAATHAQSNNRP